jgi:hypothetical protein
MYSIFFHVGWLALIEIIFYFEYIGPLETQLFKDSINHLLKDYQNNDDPNYEELIIINPYNQSQIIYLNETNGISQNYQYQVDDAEKNRLNDNNRLYTQTLIYWFYFSIIILFIRLSYLYYQYTQFENNKINKMNSISSASDLKIEMVEQRSLNYFFEEISENKSISPNKKNNNELISPRSNQMKIIEEDNFFDWKKIKKKCIQKAFHTFWLGFCIIGFEYLFFTYIVLSYKVISDEEMIYLISQLMNPFLNHLYQESI